MRVLITGGAGLVGRHLVAARASSGVDDCHVTWRHHAPPGGVTAHRVELTDRRAVRELVGRVAPDVVVHTAYSMAVRDDVVDATECVAGAAAAIDAALVHLSTDVVFDGTHPPYLEGDPVAPVNDYGRWKVAAESAATAAVPDACITRTSLVVSLDPPDPATRRLVDAVRAGERPGLFDDEVRSPVRARDLADAIWGLVAMARGERAGVWHLPGPEAMTRLELGRRLLAASGLDPAAPRPTSARDHPDPRPPDLTLRSGRPWPGRGRSRIDVVER